MRSQQKTVQHSYSLRKCLQICISPDPESLEGNAVLSSFSIPKVLPTLGINSETGNKTRYPYLSLAWSRLSTGVL